MKHIFLFVLLYSVFYITCLFFGIVHFELSYLFLIPVGMLINILAVSSGIAGAAFWFPVYLILHIDPKAASWIALCTMFFGFGSGMIKHYFQKTMEGEIIRHYLYAAMFGALIGSMIFGVINAYILIIVFGTFLILYGAKMFLNPPTIKENPNKWYSQFLALFGGVMKGIISVGIEIIITDSLGYKHNHEKIVGSVVFVVFMTNLLVIITRLLLDTSLITTLSLQGGYILDIISLVVPSVIVAGQIGPQLIKKMSRTILIRYVSILLIIVGAMMLFKSSLF